MPKVSVVMPAYNAEKYIAEAIDSILNQTFSDFEFIIINDGSTDRTKEIILSYTDPRIVYLENERNSGIVVTLNKGLDHARGEYIARMDADDIAVDERLEKQVAKMDHAPCIGVLGAGLQFLTDGEKGIKQIPSADSQKLHAELLFASCIAHPTVMIRSSILQEHHLFYDPRFEGREDYALWWNIVHFSKISAIPEVLLYYRIHSGQVTKATKAIKEKKAYAFYRYRMDSLGVDLSDEENQALFKYCCGEYLGFDTRLLGVFASAISKIIRNNKQTKFFPIRNLKEVCSLAMMYISSQSGIKKNTAQRMYTKLLVKGYFSPELYLKSVYYEYFRIRK